MALLKNSHRQANVIAKVQFLLQGDVTVLSLDRDSFKRLLGPLEMILKRNFSKY